MEYSVGKAGHDDKQNVFPANHRVRLYCAHCEQFFKGRDQLDYHRYVAHNLLSPLRCSRCQEPFQTLQLLLRHQADCFSAVRQGSMQNPIHVCDYAPNDAKHQGCHSRDKPPSTQSFIQNTPDLSQPQAANQFESSSGKSAQPVLQNCDAVSDGETLIGNSSAEGGLSSDIKKEDPAAQIYHDTSGYLSSKIFSDVPIGGGSCSVVPTTAAAPSVLHVDNEKIMLQALECSEGMEGLPYQLLKKLEVHCRNLYGKLPKFVRSKWPSQDLLCSRPSSYDCSIFVDPWERRGLKAARYTFGEKHQIIFVGERRNDVNERDSWTVVTFERIIGTTCHESFMTQQWRTWKIDGQSAGKDETVLRLCFRGKEDNIVSKFTGEITDLLDEWCSDTDTNKEKDQHRRENSSASVSSLSMQSTEYTSDDESVHGSARYPQRQRFVRSPSSSEMSEIPQHRNDSVFRQSDQAWVRLCCKDCGRKDIKTITGMMRHCLAKHSRRFKDKHEVADLCGIVLRGDDAPPTTPVGETEEVGAINPSSKSPTNPLKRNRHETCKNDPLIVFRNEVDSSKTRVRRFSCCQGIDRFFAHAQVAGTADSSTLILSVKVGGGETIQIIREDEEDFKAVMDAVKNVAEDEEQQIVVTGASLFN